MGQLMTEKDVLAKLGVKDFRSISKENIINFASMLQEMEPEVAMKALEQVPEFGEVTVLLFALALPVLMICMIFAGGLALLLPIALVAVAIGMLRSAL